MSKDQNVARAQRLSRRSNRMSRIELLDERQMMAADFFEATDLISGAEFDLFPFAVEAGDRMTAETTIPQGGDYVDTFLRLFDSAGNELAFDDDGGAGLYSAIDHVFEESGDYFLGVSGYGNSRYDPFVPDSGGHSWSSGDYELSVDIVAGESQNWVQVEQLSLTETLAGSGFNVHAVDVEAGQRISIETMQSSHGSRWMDTVVRLFDAEGNEIAVNDDGGEGFFSLLDYEFDESGRYYIGVSSYGNSTYDVFDANSGRVGSSSGEYQLMITLESPEIDSPNVELQHLAGLAGLASATAALGADDNGSFGVARQLDS